MVDSMDPADRPADIVCPWCSAAVTAQTAVCPSCNAILISDEDRDLPGVTSVDATIARPEKRPQTRGRFLSWLSGEYPEEAAPATEPDAEAVAQALAPPDEDVQREIIRLELEAQISNLQAEADSMMSDALVEGRATDLPDGLRDVADAEAAAETPQETADSLVAAAMGDPGTESPTVDEGDEGDEAATDQPEGPDRS